ncbi:hypothetical protein [Candidatus Vidania fulgoroideorum]
MKFLKMHSYGNNFIILIKENNFKKKIKKINNFFLGIGFDQAIILKKFLNKVFYLKIFNKDSSEAKNCINGIRCLFHYVSKKLKINKSIFCVKNKKIIIKSKKKKIFVFLDNYKNKIKKMLEFEYTNFFFRNIKKNIQLMIFGKYYTPLSIGNNHLINMSTKISKNKMLKELKKIKNQKFNFSFFDFFKKKILTYEKGVGFTKSCGSATMSTCVAYSNIKKKNIRIKNNCGSMYFFKKYYCIKGKSYFIYKGLIK